MSRIFLLALLNLCFFTVYSQGFDIKERAKDKVIDIFYNNQLLTSYCYYDSIKKPFLFPVNTIDGITVTRGYPIAPLPGERTDHPHHTGLWFNYESVNGLDFWNNSSAIPKEKRNGYGTIIHTKVDAKKADLKSASLKVNTIWNTPNGTTLIDEITTFTFFIKDQVFVIDRTTSLKARNDKVVFEDVKDGIIAIRVARELEMPSTEKAVFVDSSGRKTSTSLNNNISGMYYSSEGIKGDSVWGSKGRWVMLKGIKQGQQITIGIIDHPSNVGYPGYWHARGYGLFALNPLGRKVFSKGKENLQFTLKPKESVVFKYRVLIASGKNISQIDMNEWADQFASKKQ